MTRSPDAVAGGLPRRRWPRLVQAVALAVLVGGLGWALYALLSPPVIKARAIFLPASPPRDLVRPVFAAGEAIVDKIEVAADDVVKQGDVLMTLRSPVLEARIAIEKASFAQRQVHFDKLKALSVQHQTTLENLEKARRKEIEAAIVTIEREKEGYRKIMQAKGSLNAKGLETTRSAFEAQVQYDKSVNDATTQRLALLEIDSRLAKLQADMFATLAPEERHLEEQRIQIAALEQQYDLLRTIKAPRDGLVNSIFVTQGSAVGTLTPLVTLSNTEPTLEVFAFIPAEQADLLAPGMPARIRPARAGKLDHATVAAKVAYVSKTPVSKAEMRNIFFDDDLVAYFGSDAVVYLVRLTLAAPTGDKGYRAGELASATISASTAAAP